MVDETISKIEHSGQINKTEILHHTRDDVLKLCWRINMLNINVGYFHWVARVGCLFFFKLLLLFLDENNHLMCVKKGELSFWQWKINRIFTRNESCWMNFWNHFKKIYPWAVAAVAVWILLKILTNKNVPVKPQSDGRGFWGGKGGRHAGLLGIGFPRRNLPKTGISPLQTKNQRGTTFVKYFDAKTWKQE